MSNPLTELRRRMRRNPPKNELALYWQVFQQLPEAQQAMLAGAMRSLKENGEVVKNAGWHVLLETITKLGVLAEGGRDALKVAREQVWEE